MSVSSDSDTASVSDAEVNEVEGFKQKLQACLDGIQSAGEFATFHRDPAFVNPGLTIQGNRRIPLPLSQGDAKVIKTACRRAPFGKGNRTIVDTSVRNTWELDPAAFQLANPAWEAYLKTILGQAADGLGLRGITAQLDKLLLYEQGSFFKRHKDSEKETGMVGTMVVCLPSQHQGGEVLLSFKSEERNFATGPASEWDMTTLAWYSDVTHEIAKLTDGYRLVLTYKLIQAEGTYGSAEFLYKQSEVLATLLLGWHSIPDRDTMLFYPLDHQYTQVSLSLANMKGRDAAVSQILYKTCSDRGIFLFFGHLNGEAEYESEHEISLELGTVYSCDGQEIASDIRVDESRILRTGLFDRDPDSEHEEQYTGNEHTPAVSRYRETVVILVPKQHLDRLIKTSGNRYLENMVSMVDRHLRAHSDAATTSAAVAFFLRVMQEEVSDKSSITQTVMHWVMEFESDELARGLLQFASGDYRTRGIALRAACRRVERHHASRPETIEWDVWFNDVEKSCSVASWDMVLKRIPDYLESEHLRSSFEVWAQARAVQKLTPRTEEVMSQPDIGISDHDFLVFSIKSRHADSEWIMASFFPALASRGQRELLYRLLSTLFEGRNKEEFSVANAAFEYMLEHASARLSIHVADICTSWNMTPKGPCADYFTLLNQSLTIGAGDHVSKLLEATYDNLKSELNEVTKEVLLHGFLKPLVSALDSHEFSTCAPAKDILTLVIRGAFIQKLPAPPESSSGWAHKPSRCRTAGCGACKVLNKFLTSEDQQTQRFAFAKEATRAHFERVLPPRLYRITGEQAEKWYTIVVEKLSKDVPQDGVRYRVSVEQLQAQLAPLQGEFTRKLLGDECYQQLIMLELHEAGEPLAVRKRPADGVIEDKVKKGKVL